MAKVAEKPLQFMGNNVESLYTRDGAPFGQPCICAVTKNSYIDIYPDGTVRMMHFRRAFKKADTLVFGRNGGLQQIILPASGPSNFDVLSEGRDVPYKIREEGTTSWLTPNEAQNLPHDSTRVRSELGKAWEYYGKNSIEEQVSGFKSSNRVRAELARIPPPSMASQPILE